MRFEVAHHRHIRLISASMRARDIAEIQWAVGQEPERAMREALEHSFYARTLFMGLEPLAMYGLAPLSMLAGHARIWIFGTSAIDRHKIAFTRASKLAISALFCHCSLMTNIVATNDEAAIKWLKWLGGSLVENKYAAGFTQFVIAGGAQACRLG
jgi:hypothetical protein